MPSTTDPFTHYPELRDLISNSETSFFRNVSVERVIEQFPQMEAHRDWPYTDTEREALRHATFSGHSGDLWVFCYGSLMWDPALRFAEVRRAHVADYARWMILLDCRGGRGTEEAPGLMAALDEGQGCDDLVFRIAADAVDTETEILFCREMLAPGYHARFVDAMLDDGPVRALTFVADHAVPRFRVSYRGSSRYALSRGVPGFLGLVVTTLQTSSNTSRRWASMTKTAYRFCKASTPIFPHRRMSGPCDCAYPVLRRPQRFLAYIVEVARPA